jgi:5,10-methylenetetrahydrofolate reductase
MSRADSIDVWIDMYHAMERLARRDTVIFLTDNAVGQAEEENLSHLSGNLPEEVDRRRVVPFLTSKHSIEYCHMYANRAAESGFDAITVLGGDQSVGPPRCVPHALELRGSIRRRVPELRLGGWANPHRDPAGQAGFVTSREFEIDFYLTQIVSHHRLDVVERFLEEVERRDSKTPAVFGVFFYRSARAETLRWLSRFFPVPVEDLERDFGRGMSPVEICATTIRALRRIGAEKVYLSNLGLGRIDRLYGDISAAADG